MIETKVSSATREVIISDQQPTVLIGERINPTGKKKLQEALRAGNMDVVRAGSNNPGASRSRHT